MFSIMFMLKVGLIDTEYTMHNVIMTIYLTILVFYTRGRKLEMTLNFPKPIGSKQPIRFSTLPIQFGHNSALP